MKPTIKEVNKKRLNFTIWSRQTDKKILKISKRLGIAVIVACFFAASLITIKDEIIYTFGGEDGYEDMDDGEFYEEEDCNVLAIELHGDLTTYIAEESDDENAEEYQADQTASEDVVRYVEMAEEDEEIKAIVLEIDSFGGIPVAGEEIAEALKRAEKPTVAVIRNAGLSSAYFAATGADVIFASLYSDVGSIGVTWSYLDYAGQNQKEGLTFNQVSSGIFKDMGNPDKPLTPAEKSLAMRDIDIMEENFIKAVAENRKLEIEKVRQLADGSSMLGQMALEKGLIDKIGGLDEVEAYLKEIIGEEPELCWP